MTDSGLDHGEWTDPNSPPSTIAPFATVFVESESDGFATGTEGHIRYSADGAWSERWFRIGDPNFGDGFTLPGLTPISVVSRNPDHVDLFAVGKDDAVYTTYYDTNGGWFNRWFRIGDPNFGDGFTLNQRTPISVVSRTPDHVDLFAVGKDDAVYTTYYDTNGGWFNRWFRIGDPNFGDGFTLNQRTPISVVSRTPDHVDLFAVGKDDAVYTTYYDTNGGWFNRWFRIGDPNFGDGFTLPGLTPISVVSRNPDHVDLFAVGKDDAVYTTYYDTNGGWFNRWFRIGDPNFGDGFTLPGLTPISVVSRNPDHVDLFAVGKDDAVYTTYYDTNGGWFNRWFRIGDSNFGDGFTLNQRTPVALVARDQNHLDLVAVGKDDAVYTTFYDTNGGWSNRWVRNGDTNFGDGFTLSPLTPISIVSRTDDHIDLFAVGKDEAVYTTYSGGQFYFYWYNPFVGRNSYHQGAPLGTGVSFSGGFGNNSELDVQIVPARRVSVPNFEPSVNAFHFDNRWPDESLARLIKMPDPFGDITIGNASNGICGGMAYAVADYYNAGQLPPAQTTNPAGIGDPLFDYLVSRLFDSFDLPDGPVVYWHYMEPAYPDTPRVDADGRSWVMAHEAFPAIMAAVDSGRPCPLGLVMVKSLLPTDLGENHQVLAYAYLLEGGIATIWVYDPNSPNNDEVTIRFDLSDAGVHIDVGHNVNASRPIYALFATPYSPQQPVGGRPR
ncbi:hypothetical protein KIV56_13325 [Cryobacterium breve]|uniref:Peptidase C39-like domain-containing protein n=1 Tax=Cryobacterium breve TaxID=1259258 RepID=A0ABY7NCV0_9MICO|nr:hypothetical protein [Cryobacterium breve]WBM79373.1 hypothetical protein KIV56_13325 [Cryobacterium breve]